MNYDPHQIQIARDRVITFENEMQERVNHLSNIEKNMIKISEERRASFSRQKLNNELDDEIFIKKMKILKFRNENAIFKLNYDLLRLEELQEMQSLQYLVTATKPFGLDESEEQRNKIVSNVLRKNAESWRLGLLESIRYRTEILSENEFTHKECELIQAQFSHDSKLRVEEFTQKIKNYMVKLNELGAKTKQNHEKVMAAYLVLRHNARVARAILKKSQDEAAKQRTELKERLDALSLTTKLEREKLEKVHKAEINFRTEEIRRDVIAREQLIEELKIQIKQQQKVQIKSKSEYKSQVKYYNKLYNDLQLKRRSNIMNSNQELKQLRSMVYDIELKIQQQRRMGLNDSNENSHEELFFHQTLREIEEKINQLNIPSHKIK